MPNAKYFSLVCYNTDFTFRQLQHALYVDHIFLLLYIGLEFSIISIFIELSVPTQPIETGRLLNVFSTPGVI